MKQKILTLALMALVFAAAWGATTYKDPTQFRINGTSTGAGGVYTMAMDSTDTFDVDTLTSDKLDLINSTTGEIDFDELMCLVELTAFTLCDSCNDSAIIITEFFGGMTTDQARAKRLAVDTFQTNPNVAGDTIWYYASRDSIRILYRYFWTRTIIKDSVILGEGTTSSTFQINQFLMYQ